MAIESLTKVHGNLMTHDMRRLPVFLPIQNEKTY